MGLLKNWRKRRRLRHIPAEFLYESFYESLKTFIEDMFVGKKVSKRKYPKQKTVPTAKKVIYKSNYKGMHYGSKKKYSRKEVEPLGEKMILKTYYEGMYDATFKIVIFGDEGVPKAELTQRFLTNLFKTGSRMTIGVDFEVKNLDVDNKKVKLQIWDFGGEERFRFLLPMYVRGANGALFLYDVNNYSSLAHIDDWLMVVKKEIKPEDEFPIMVVGIVSEPDIEREVPSEEGIQIAKARGVDGFAECSPRTGENVEETFEALTRLMLTSSGIIA